MPPIRNADAASAILIVICHLPRIRPSNRSRPCFGVNRLTAGGAESSILPSARDAARFLAARDSTEIMCPAPLIAPIGPVKYRGRYSRPANASSGNDFDQSTIPSTDTQNHNLGGAANFAAVSLTARNSKASIVRTGNGSAVQGNASAQNSYCATACIGRCSMGMTGSGHEYAFDRNRESPLTTLHRPLREKLERRV
jgi:hypothetical protein